jgi:hypothetical protein
MTNTAWTLLQNVLTNPTRNEIFLWLADNEVHVEEDWLDALVWLKRQGAASDVLRLFVRLTEDFLGEHSILTAL